MEPDPLTKRLDALLRHEALPWAAFGAEPEVLLARCEKEDLTALVHARVTAFRDARDWPVQVRRELERAAHASAAAELVRQREIVSVLDLLAAAGVHPVLFKGASLAYTVYGAPSLRPRRDTDLFIRRDQSDTVRRAMAERGYVEALQAGGDLVLCQFELSTTDQFGLDHAFDFHWKVSTQPVFADSLTYGELEAVATPVPALGPHARAAGPVHALLVACMHPVMHHRNVERPIWVYDVHLLASRLSGPELDRFAELAIDRRVATICARQLALSRARLNTLVPEQVMARLSRPAALEPSSAYLQSGRRWHHDLWSGLGNLGRWSDRLRLLREVILPRPRYMLDAYRVGRMGVVLLPALYVHRTINGAWKVLTRRK